MRIDNGRQAQELLLALALGIGAGLLYDLLRPPRWRFGGLRAFLLDALYCLVTGTGLFFYAMSVPDGRLGIGALAAAWTGFLLYHAALSPRLLPQFSKMFQILDKACVHLKKSAKKMLIFEKSSFKK